MIVELLTRRGECSEHTEANRCPWNEWSGGPAGWSLVTGYSVPHCVFTRPAQLALIPSNHRSRWYGVQTKPPSRDKTSFKVNYLRFRPTVNVVKWQEQQRVAVGTRKRSFHFWSPGGGRLRCCCCCCCCCCCYKRIYWLIINYYDLSQKSVTVARCRILSLICVESFMTIGWKTIEP